MKEININIPESVVDVVQCADIKVQTMQSVISTYLESHALDTDLTAIESPVFVAYQARLEAAKLAFEKAKDDMVNEYIEESLRDKITSWNLNYSSCVLHAVQKD